MIGYALALTVAAAAPPPVDTPQRGHFLTFETPGAAALHRDLMERRIVTDVRGDRIRFGFGCYHAPSDIERVFARLAGTPVRAAS